MPTFDARPFDSAINVPGEDANHGILAAPFDVQTTAGLASIAAVRERFLADPMTDRAASDRASRSLGGAALQ